MAKYKPSVRLPEGLRVGSAHSKERIPIEGKFDQGKNGYRLNYIRAKLQKTSEAWINLVTRPSTDLC